MSQMIDAARSGMLQHERHVELIANNLANMNTPGYKRLAVHFSDLLTTEAALAVLADGEPVSTTSGVELDRTERIQEPGALVPSGDPLSMAIVGAGYFAVALADGTPAYTRDGSFSRDAEGFVTTPNGFRLQPPLQITGAVAELVIRSDGTVLVNRGGGGGGARRKRWGSFNWRCSGTRDSWSRRGRTCSWQRWAPERRSSRRRVRTGRARC